jgi:hypothetical protein
LHGNMSLSVPMDISASEYLYMYNSFLSPCYWYMHLYTVLPYLTTWWELNTDTVIRFSHSAGSHFTVITHRIPLPPWNALTVQ